MVSKEQIVSLLATKDKAVARALVVLNERQTADEQDSKATRLDNGMGFKPCHARMGTSMAQFYQRFGYLSPKQIAYWRKTDAKGTMRHCLLLETTNGSGCSEGINQSCYCIK
jgi:hypothetical protein